MPVHGDAQYLRLHRIGADALDSAAQASASASAPAVCLTTDGTVLLRLAPGRSLAVMGHPAVRRDSDDSVPTSSDCGVVNQVLLGNTNTVIWEARDRHDDPTHLLHRIVDPLIDAEGRPTSQELVSTGRTVRLTGSVVFMTGSASRNRTNFVPAGTYTTVDSVAGPAVVLVQRVAPADPDPRQMRVAVPIRRLLPPPLPDPLATVVLLGVVAETYPNFLELMRQDDHR